MRTFERVFGMLITSEGNNVNKQNTRILTDCREKCIDLN